MRTLTALVCAFMLVPASQAAAATLRVAPSGSDSAACTTTAPCASFNRAYQASRPGDTIEVAGGSYGGQTVNAKHAVGTAKVTFRPLAGAAVTIGSLSNYANEVTYTGMRAAPIGSSLGNGVVSARAGTNVLFQFLSGRKPYVWGASATSAPINNTFKGGVWREQIGCAGGASIQVKGYRVDDNSIVNPRNIVFDGLDISGYKLPSGCSGTPHQDCIHTFYVDGFTLKNSKIHGCEHFGILADSDMIADSSPTGADNIVIENNMFWDAGIADIRPRGDACSGGTCVEKFDGLTVRHNSTESDLIGAATYRNAVWQNNVSKSGVNCVSGITYGGNISPTGSGPCANDRRAATGFVSATDFHLTATAPARDQSRGTSHPATDIDGQLRDAMPDAGADEYGGAAPTPNPTPTPTPTPDPTPAPGNEVLADVADAFTDSGAPASNFGGATRLPTADAPLRRTWLKFAKPAADSNATATLRIYSDTATSKATYVYGAPEGWTETGLTHRNAPALSARVATVPSLVRGWNTIQVPLSGQDTSSTLSFVLVRTDPAGAEVAARSRESAERPTLTIPR